MDHPRSRGVYSASPTSGADRQGSSPLARGLRQPRPHSRAYRRIIPARAGFTYKDTSGLEVGTDHPRSRGVYSGDTSGVGSTAGSSPLARGLLLFTTPEVNAARIIPARAGFTSARSRSPYCGQDHPRSRGVYEHDGRPFDDAVGSSPLARGLLINIPFPANSGGIIPARAGFTLELAGTVSSAQDHPRSRGVYTPFRVTLKEIGGSSPLARGLQPEAYLEVWVSGIIPARAGFTLI